ncbi:MAG: 16S rRNA (uracil(1498)-N(3))-methyltransferase [Treponema sp.]|nr:16S rRNA (uracil(1498)-N(3))-methyltransferase [Treponema sp.]
MRQYVSAKPFDGAGLLEVVGKDFRYFKNVLRLRVGDMVRVCEPGGSSVNSTLCALDERAKKIVLQRCDGMDGENQSDYSGRTEIWLFMFAPKPSRAEIIVRQATECGVFRIIPVQSDFSSSGSEKINFKSERFSRIIKEARQQSGSLVQTEVGECVSLERAVSLWRDETEKVGAESVFSAVLYERNEQSVTMRGAFNRKKKGPVKKACIACGSEGGISPNEIAFLKASGFEIIHFDTNILRCETACLYGIAVLQAELTEVEREENEQN